MTEELKVVREQNANDVVQTLVSTLELPITFWESFFVFWVYQYIGQYCLPLFFGYVIKTLIFFTSLILYLFATFI